MARQLSLPFSERLRSQDDYGVINLASHLKVTDHSAIKWEKTGILAIKLWWDFSHGLWSTQAPDATSTHFAAELKHSTTALWCSDSFRFCYENQSTVEYFLLTGVMCSFSDEI